MQTLLPKTTFYQDSDYVVEIQDYEGALYLHVEVENWDLNAMKKAYRVFSRLQQEAKDFGYDYLRTITPNPKFAKLFGGSTIDRGQINGIDFEVIEWDLTH